MREDHNILNGHLIFFLEFLYNNIILLLNTRVWPGPVNYADMGPTNLVFLVWAGPTWVRPKLKGGIIFPSLLPACRTNYCSACTTKTGGTKEKKKGEVYLAWEADDGLVVELVERMVVKSTVGHWRRKKLKFVVDRERWRTHHVRWSGGCSWLKAAVQREKVEKSSAGSRNRVGEANCF